VSNEQAEPQSWFARFAIFAGAGAISGLVVALVSVLVEFFMKYWQSGMSLLDFIDGTRARWQEDFLDARFLGGPIWGLIGGVLPACLSRTSPHPIMLASLWASIMGCVALVAAVLLNDDKRVHESAAMVGLALGMGAIYGFVLGFAAQVLFRFANGKRGPESGGPNA